MLTRVRNAGGAVRRAWAGPGRERDIAAQAFKAALAAWLSWAVVGWWLHAPMAFVAPWVAILLVESTVYQSVAHALQQLVAIAAGTAMATALMLVMHNRLGAMGLVLPLVVLLSSWWRLGRQGIYTATGAIFVLTDTQVGLASSAARIAEAAFGAVVGIAVNALIRPPVYLRDAHAQLGEAAEATGRLLEAPAGHLADGRWGVDDANAWHEQALRLKHLVEQCRSAVGWSRESLWGNVRRRSLATERPHADCESALVVFDYAAVHTTELTRTLLEAAHQERQADWSRLPLIRTYAGFLSQAADVVRRYAESGFGQHRAQQQDGEESMARDARKLRDTVDGLRQQMPDSAVGEPEEVSAYGALLLQAQRLAELLDSSAREDAPRERV